MTIVNETMYQAFKAVLVATNADNETQADLYKNAIEAAIDAEAPWFRFLAARAAALNEFIAEGDTVEEAMHKLHFHDVAHAQRVHIRTRKEK